MVAIVLSLEVDLKELDDSTGVDEASLCNSVWCLNVQLSLPQIRDDYFIF